MPTQHIELAKLKKLPNNPRKIGNEQFEILVTSIKDNPDYFEARPIICSNRTGELVILAGNQRFDAAKKLKMEIVPVYIMENITEEREKEIIIRDNISNGDWDQELLKEWDAEKLKDWGLELDQVEIIEAKEDDFDIEDIEEIKTNIKLGDLFQIGNHRLLCGDSTQSEDVEKLMNGQKADLYITDPPYGVSYIGKTKSALTIKNDAMSSEQTHTLWRDSFNIAMSILKDGASIYATVPAGSLQVGFMQVMIDTNTLHQCMVWDKGQMVLGHSDYHYQHEQILYGWKAGASHYFINDRTKTTVLNFAKPIRNAEHPTMKPIELWAELINNSSVGGAICYDGFLGSGTTMVACQQLNRKCYGIELDPKYCQVILDRMKKCDPNIEIKQINNERIEISN